MYDSVKYKIEDDIYDIIIKYPDPQEITVSKRLVYDIINNIITNVKFCNNASGLNNQNYMIDDLEDDLKELIKQIIIDIKNKTEVELEVCQ